LISLQNEKQKLQITVGYALHIRSQRNLTKQCGNLTCTFIFYFIPYSGSASTVTYDSTNSSRNSWVSGTTRRDTIVSRKLECAVHVWSPSPHHHRRKSIKPRGVICAFHGIPGHFQSPTDKYLPELLSQYNYVVYGMEIPGYGKSQSRKGSSANDIIQHGINLALYAHVKVRI